jgi:hypothetical protein
MKRKSGRSICMCGHDGDGSESCHAGEGGHGYCLVETCRCGKFTWADFTPEYKKILKQLKKEIDNGVSHLYGITGESPTCPACHNANAMLQHGTESWYTCRDCEYTVLFPVMVTWYPSRTLKYDNDIQCISAEGLPGRYYFSVKKADKIHNMWMANILHEGYDLITEAFNDPQKAVDWSFEFIRVHRSKDPNEFELDQLQDQFEEFLLDKKTGGCNRGWCTRCKFEPVCQGQELIV